MLHKTRGIVFKTTEYSETSVIAKIYTELFGLQTYMVQGAKKPKAKIRLNMLQPLHLLEMVVYHNDRKDLQRIKELRQVPVLQQIPYDIRKSSQIFFLNELLYRTVQQEQPDESLFSFMFSSIEFLDSMEDGIANFHLHFLLRLTRFLGFYPDSSSYRPNSVFDLIDGRFNKGLPSHAHYLSAEEAVAWKLLLETPLSNLSSIRMNQSDRKIVLSSILTYYKLHLPGFSALKSHQVLEEVFSD